MQETIILCTMLSGMSEIPTYHMCLHGQILSPIKQNEEILRKFPHFSLFSILYSPDSLHASIGATRFKAAIFTRDSKPLLHLHTFFIRLNTIFYKLCLLSNRKHK